MPGARDPDAETTPLAETVKAGLNEVTASAEEDEVAVKVTEPTPFVFSWSVKGLPAVTVPEVGVI